MCFLKPRFVAIYSFSVCFFMFQPLHLFFTPEGRVSKERGSPKLNVTRRHRAFEVLFWCFSRHRVISAAS
jgi:hypothetical protein